VLRPAIGDGAVTQTATHDRIERLERELRQAFEEAQREADAMFAQYQLSQLLASGGRLTELCQAVVAEIVRLCAAAAGGLWLAEPGGRLFRLASASPGAPLPDSAGPFTRDELMHLVDAVVVTLGDEPADGIIGLWPGADASLDREGLRVVQLSRHELAVAFRGAQLREMLERERQELTAIVDGATDAIIQVDQDCRVLRINPAARQLLGAASSAVGQSCHEVLRCAAAGAHGTDACPLAEVIHSGRPIAYREAAILDASGNVVRVAGGYSRAASEPGGRVRATAILRDISAIRALEQLREGFVATVSHELRTPLALIRGYTDTLLHLQLEPGEQRQYLERIDGATERLTTLVKDILDIAHLQADPLVLQRGHALFGSLIARLRGDLGATGQDHRLVVTIPPDLPPIDVDSARIGQVLENLVGNALKYSRPDAPVTLGTAVTQDWLMVTVEDEGVGIPEADRALVLEPFHRGQNVRESSIQGTGLGLYISQRLVEAHSGKLWLAERADGRPGTRVSFTLPLAKESSGAQ
jgi:two-component system phosphate regulon sensor histidine kinase PhoR